MGALVGQSCDLSSGVGIRVLELQITVATSSINSDSTLGSKYEII